MRYKKRFDKCLETFDKLAKLTNTYPKNCTFWSTIQAIILAIFKQHGNMYPDKEDDF